MLRGARRETSCYFARATHGLRPKPASWRRFSWHNGEKYAFHLHSVEPSPPRGELLVATYCTARIDGTRQGVMTNPAAKRYGCFHLLRGPSPLAPVVHARIQEDDVIEVIIGASAFSGALCGNNMFVVGMQEPPSADFAAVLLAAPGTIARLVKREVGDNTCSFLEFSCWDECNVQAQMVIGVKSMDANLVIPDALRGLVTALAAMEAVVQEVEAERTANMDQTMEAESSEAVDKGLLARLYQPTLVKGKAIQLHSVYKKTVLRDVADIGNRAYYQASEASSLRRDVLIQREKRKQSERRARAIKRERRQSILKKEKDPKTPRTKLSFFDDEPKTEDTPMIPKAEPSTIDFSTPQQSQDIAPTNTGANDCERNSTAGNNAATPPQNPTGVTTEVQAQISQQPSALQEVRRPTQRRRKKKRLV